MSQGPDDFRHSALSAFSHEIRTPLTAIRMICDLATPTEDGGKMLDAELLQMLDSSLLELQTLLDDLQDLSRAERGALALDITLAELQPILTAAAAHVPDAVIVTYSGALSASGLWDVRRLERAISGISAGVNRLGNGSGGVEAEVSSSGSQCCIVLRSGNPKLPLEDSRPPEDSLAAAEFAFFPAVAAIEAMGGSVLVENPAGYCKCTVTLPTQHA